MTSSVVLHPFFSDWRTQLIMIGILIGIPVLLAWYTRHISKEMYGSKKVQSVSKNFKEKKK